MTTFNIGKQEYNIKLTYGLSVNVLPDKFNINLTKIFVDSELASKTMETLVLDDERTLSLMWFFVEPTASIDYDTFLEKVSPQELEEFREAFWAEVVNFSGSLKKNMMLQMWTEFKKELKKAHLTTEPSEQ